MEKLNEMLTGKHIILHTKVAENTFHRYEGICVECTDVVIIVKDFKTGIVVLPLSTTNIQEVTDGEN